MNRYETIFIVDADVNTEDRKSIFDRATAQLDTESAKLIQFDDWGVRKLAYEIKKKKQGHYVRLDYCGNGEIVNALERMFRHDSRILRFMTVNLESNVDPEAIIAAMKQAKEFEPEGTEKENPDQAPAEDQGASGEDEKPKESAAGDNSETATDDGDASGKITTNTETGDKE